MVVQVDDERRERQRDRPGVKRDKLNLLGGSRAV